MARKSGAQKMNSLTDRGRARKGFAATHFWMKLNPGRDFFEIHFSIIASVRPFFRPEAQRSIIGRVHQKCRELSEETHFSRVVLEKRSYSVDAKLIVLLCVNWLTVTRFAAKTDCGGFDLHRSNFCG